MIKPSRIFFLFSILLSASIAQAGSISFMGGGSWYNSQVSNVPAGSSSQGTGSQLGYGGGMLLNFQFGDSPFSLETGGLYMHHKQTFGSGFMSTNEAQIPLDIRLWASRVFSVGAGGYYGIGLGNLQETNSSGSTTYNGPYTGIRTQNDFGALGSVRIQIPLGNVVNFLVNGNYLYGLRNVNDTGDGSTLKTREIQTLVGFSFDW